MSRCSIIQFFVLTFKRKKMLIIYEKKIWLKVRLHDCRCHWIAYKSTKNGWRNSRIKFNFRFWFQIISSHLFNIRFLLTAQKMINILKQLGKRCFLFSFSIFAGRYVGSRPIKLRKSTWKQRSFDVVKRKEKEKAQLLQMFNK